MGFTALFLPTDIQPLHVAALISLSVFVILLLAGQRIRARQSIQRRATSTGDGANLVDTSPLRSAELLERVARLVAPSQNSGVPAIREQLVQAGFFSPVAVPLFYASRLLLAVAFPIVFVTFSGLLPVAIPLIGTLVLAVILSVLGLILPAIYVDRRRLRMQQRYRNAFPDFMDMMVVCIEAGQSLQGAIERVSREIVQACPELGANLHLVSLELRAGRSLNDALQGLSGRLGIEEVRSLTLLLKQSEELGTSIANTLRVYSDEMRDKRLMRAETKAHTLPVKMTIPLGLFIFPVILLVIMVPVIIRIKNAFL
jgi:tight adherence protein C